MNKKIVLFIVVLTIIIIGGFVFQRTIFRGETNQSQITETSSETISKDKGNLTEVVEFKGDIQKCLLRQKETWNVVGDPIGSLRVPNECEVFAQKTNDLDIIQIISETMDFPTLVALSRNKNVPTEILTKVYQRKDDPNLDWEFYNTGNYYVGYWPNQVIYSLNRNVNTAPSILTEFGKSSDSYLLEGVATNPSTPADTLRLLAQSDNSYVLTSLASNPLTPEDILVYLAQDLPDVSYPFMGEDSIHIELARNPSAPQSVLVKFLREKGNTVIIFNFQDNIVRIENEILDLENYYINSFPSNIGEVPLWNGNYYSLLEQLATNPKTSESVLNTIISRNYNTNFNGKTLAQLAQENLNSRN